MFLLPQVGVPRTLFFIEPFDAVLPNLGQADAIQCLATYLKGVASLFTFVVESLLESYECSIRSESSQSSNQGFFGELSASEELIHDDVRCLRISDLDQCLEGESARKAKRLPSSGQV